MDTVVYSNVPTIDESYQRNQLPESVQVETHSLTDEKAVVDAARAATVLVTGPYTPVTAEVLDAAAPNEPDAVLQASTGVDNIDVAAVTEHEVTVAHVPDYCTPEVATHAIGLLMAARRQIPAHDRKTKAGGWEWETERAAPRFAGSSLGLVSFGRIAQQVATYLEGFGLDLLVYDPYIDDSTVDAYGATRVAFEELLERSDAVSVHSPLTPETRGLFDQAAFERMRDHAVLVNVGRGGVVDEQALCQALKRDEIAAAALDVFAEEPPEDTPLADRDDVIMTPHSGWYSEDAQQTVNKIIVENIGRVLAGETPRHCIESEQSW